MSQSSSHRLKRYAALPMLILLVFAIWNLIFYTQEATPTSRQEQTIETPIPVAEISPNPASTLLPGNLDQVTFIDDGQTYTISQLLPQDAIRPIYNPQFTDNPESYRDDELIMGVEINGDARAYSVGYLVRREMVNDIVGGIPILVTW